MNTRSNLVNGLSTAVVAVFFTQVLHEFVHFAAARAVGANVWAFNLFAVNIQLFHDPNVLWKDMVIESSASIINVVVGTIALLLFHSRKKLSVLTRQFLLQLTAYSYLMGFGYFLFDGLFYTPGTPGDWKSVLNMLDGSVPLRIVLIAVGALGMLFTLFWLGRNVLIFAKEKQSQSNRFNAAYPVLLVPYIVLGALYILLSVWHPLGWPNGFTIVFFQFVFGFSGLLWGFFLAVYWLNPDGKDRRRVEPQQNVSIPWVVLAAGLLIFQIAVLLPTVNFL